MSLYKSIGVAAIATTLMASPLAAQQGKTTKWEGFYAGLNVGGLWETTSAAIGLNNTTGRLDGVGSGFVGGAQAGYNYLLGPVLLGGEIDFQGSTFSSNINGGAGASTISAVETVPWFSTMRVRAGYPVGSVMPYITGGAVWGNEKLSGGDSANGGSFSASTNFWTYTFGGGMEGHITDQWSAKLEYLYIGTPNTTLSSPATTSIDERAIGNLLRVGVNYTF
jgi:outer membrane immunogenic protein